jgi:membrane protein DedA with SNARE-associated domain
MSDISTFTDLVLSYGYLAIFIAMFFEGLCIPIPSELIMGFSGFMAFENQLTLPGVIAAGWLGSLCGSTTIYYFSRKNGRDIMYRWGHLIHLGPERMVTISHWFDRYGPTIIIPWRQLPIIRTKISIAAGLLDMKHAIFLFYTALGIAVWCALAACLGFYLGQNWPLLLAFFIALGHYILAILSALLLCGGGYLYYRHHWTGKIGN